MKILILMAGFLPGKKYGGPPVSIDNFCSLMNEFDCYIVTRNHDLGDNTIYRDLEDGWNNRGNCKVLYVADSDYKKSTFEKVINEIQPNIIYLQGVFQSCILPCLQLAKKHGISILLAPRGELCTGALSIKKWKKIPYIEGLKSLGVVKNIYWQSTSDEETESIKKLMKANDDSIYRLDNIPSIPKKEYQRKQKTVGIGRFVFLSRIHPKKNLLSAIKYFIDIRGQVQFDIYGPIEDEDYWKACQEQIKRLPYNVVAVYKGIVSHDEVHEEFSQYDAFLFPTFSENYGHVIAESLIVGTPVIISDQTPWRDLEKAKAGWDLSLQREELFKESIQRIVNMDETEYNELSVSSRKYAIEKIGLEKLRESYHVLFCALK